MLALAAAAVGALIGRPVWATNEHAAPANGAIRIPAREIPPPASISPQARAYLVEGAAKPYAPPPPLDDLAAWKHRIAAEDQQFVSMAGVMLDIPGPRIETQQLGGVTVHVATPAAGSEPHKAHLYIHGGGFVGFAGKPAMILAKSNAMFFGGVVYGVDYRTPPDHPFPAPLDDCLSVYREVLKRYAPDKILVSGESAGGNLAAALMLKARDAGLPTPAALFLNSPGTDMTFASDSLQTNQYIDVLEQRPSLNHVFYVGDADPNHPYLSPVKGDLSHGFPPTYLRTGTRDLLLSDTVRMHAALRRAGVDADLFVGEAMPHGGLGGRSPEDIDALNDTIRWLREHWTG